LLLALVGVVATSAVATGTAAASLQPELVNKEGKELVKKKFTSSSGKSTFETTAGEKIECSESKGTGEITGKRTDTASITFKGCSTKEIITVKCASKGAKEGEILLTTNSKLVFINEKEATVGEDLELVGTLTIVCEAFGIKETLTVRGSTICPTTTALSETATLTCKQTKGKQEPTEYEEEGKKTKDITETQGEGQKKFAFTESGLASTNTLKFEEAVEVMK
jgi:hypothetical protein